MPSKPPIFRPKAQLARQAERKTAKAERDKVNYDWQWRKLRNQHIKANPICLHCLSEGITREAKEVDHIEPVSRNPERRLDPSNLQSLCHSHHQIKSAAESRRRNAGSSEARS
ncbi:HNH endonuclease [Siccirubricoccus sp. KC 17139]|uniref:Putative HNH nuclease YajD n=1 Tax=Siccirubricoccus soli TaxID=2899147 RepID=A0ABT1CYQ6_9PROT|nr:HNH endonuclease signature motif containing protein [Siccirubricoccus soli]MCO6414803.1 HNH endonuclease [Siccirubricoccus soli]MCP2680933.1 HNH endonuclease [Siccirubricoccus soli]